MYFPHFAGKSYDFVIFQGFEQKTVLQGIIPQDGQFTLSIPKEYTPYKGMGRWLITGTKEGGGLDIYIPGHNFSVNCDSEIPNNTNIIYKDNSDNAELGELSKVQQETLDRYQVMLQAVNIFTTNDRNYRIFKSEYNKQKKDYEKFQKLLTKRADYISEFIRIVNITNGIGVKLFDKEIEKADNICFYITHNLDWNILYTSGYWWSVISAWVSIHTKVLTDKNRFIREFELISSKLIDKRLHTDFISRLNYFLKEEGKDDYISIIDL
ncbi:alkyl hydroperoxide reductase [Elizabethkingia anophelis]|nr:alkyl hydroperoxide reductase [Elizabethkingia anophelis]MDV3601512.1 alkyl hydroperoxide reductase [Elizabethkingia anophelis]MDV3608571.1 alkyl hydroperoxide reductase [Elizabethkingia anophelis]MDV3640617.1 alkyl hydroperoxide reductase [Elizabethkingia anophelis]MDV3651465.1 alkyl hydroperoxide reductase [Elizabethkingia anophelis]